MLSASSSRVLQQFLPIYTRVFSPSKESTFLRLLGLLSSRASFLLHGSFSIRDATIIPFWENAFEIHSEV